MPQSYLSLGTAKRLRGCKAFTISQNLIQLTIQASCHHVNVTWHNYIGKDLKTNTAWNGEELTKSKAFKKINIENDVVVMTFNKIGDYWYPGTYIRDIVFTVQVILLGKKSPMKRLSLHSECVITNVNTLKFSAISKMEIPSTLYYFQVYLKNHCQNYNPAEWGNYTAIKSETNFSTIVEDISRMNSLEEAPGN